MDTLASSSSEDSYKRKRDRSRTRKDVKGRKKVRRRSYSRDSSKDTLYARKRKKAKRRNEDEAREKPSQKKKIRREVSVSSSSSGSRSCSTCQGGSASSDDDSHYESRRGRSETKGKDNRRFERGRSGNEKSSRYRARSCSSCSLGSGSSDEGVEDKYKGENNSRRLRSVITVTKEAEESGELYRNETKEEIVDDHEYPCRSNDSNDGGTKKEPDHHIFPSSEEKLRVEDEIGDVNAEFNFVELKTVDRSYNNGSNLKVYGAGTSESMKKETSGTSGANLDGDDLESVLRQKALENLKKFRGEVQSTAKASDQKYKIVSQEKQPPTDKHELVQGKYIVNNADAGTKFNKQTPVEETSLPVRRRNLIAYPTNNETILNMDKDISGSAKHLLACAPEKLIDAGNPSETVKESNNCRTNKPDLNKPESFHDSHKSHSYLKQTPVSGLPQQKLMVAESPRDRVISAHVVSHSSNDNVNNIRGLSSGVPKPSNHGPKFRHTNLNKGQDEVKEHSQFELKQTSASDEPPNAKSLLSEGDVERSEAKTTQAAIQSINNNGSEVGESRNSATAKSCVESSSVENNSGKLQDGSNQGSQFEQKTMNVMRGGEMVQVSICLFLRF